MAMNIGGRTKAEINVTPMIDVLLVLLIIFMVVISLDTRGLETQVPQESKGPPIERPQDVIILVHADRSVTLNTESLTEPEIEPRLQTIYGQRGKFPIFIAGDDDIEFDAVAHVIDIAKGVGLDQVALWRSAPRQSQ
jgi:biopolymer transport protein ExbD